CHLGTVPAAVLEEHRRHLVGDVPGLREPGVWPESFEMLAVSLGEVLENRLALGVVVAEVDDFYPVAVPDLLVVAAMRGHGSTEHAPVLVETQFFEPRMRHPVVDYLLGLLCRLGSLVDHQPCCAGSLSRLVELEKAVRLHLPPLAVAPQAPRH